MLNIDSGGMGGVIARAILRCALMLSSNELHAREVSGVTMPEVISVRGNNLRLNGMGTLKKAFFIKVYVVGLYLETPTTDARTAVVTDEAKRIVIDMLRDVDRKTFVGAVEAAIMLNSGPAMPALRSRVDLLEKSLPALKKGDLLEFTYLTGAGTLMRCHGQNLTILGEDFARALFSIWLGPKPVNGTLKRELLSPSLR